MSQEIRPTAAADESGESTDKATLHISAEPLDITVSAQGMATSHVALGVIGPAATIAVGSFVGLPVLAIVLICVLQIVMASWLRRRT